MFIYKMLSIVLKPVVAIGLLCCVNGCPYATGRHSVNTALGGSDADSEYFRSLQFLIPTNYLSDSPWPVSVLDAEQARRAFGKEVALPKGTYSLMEISQLLAQKTGKEVIWYPSVKTSDDRVLAQSSGRLVEIIDSSEDKKGYGLRIHSPTPLYMILQELISYATEVGVGSSNSDRYWRAGGNSDRDNVTHIWCAFLSERTIVFLNMPVSR